MRIYHGNDGATFSREEIIPESSDEKMYDSFSEFYKAKKALLCKKKGRTVSTREIGAMIGLDNETFRKFVGRERTTKKRDCIIAICAVIGCDATETNVALSLYGFPELNEYHRRDELIWDRLAESPDTPVSVAEINEALAAERYPLLDIHEHRNQKKTLNPSSLYKLVRRHFQCSIEGIGRRDEPECFLDLLYDVDVYYSMRTCFEYVGQGRRFEICIQYEEAQSQRPDNIWEAGIRRRISPKCRKYIVYKYPTEEQGSELQEYRQIADTGAFRPCFLEIEKTEQAEKKRLYDTVNDTRNYGSRISAKVIDSQLHVFCETYNCDIPELSEYYLMDSCSGAYTLYVLNRSCFMQMYLSAEKYEQIYGKQPVFRMMYLRDTWDDTAELTAGKCQDPVLDQFASEEEIEDSVYEARDVGTFEAYSEKTVTGLRLKAYRKMKAQIEVLTERLRNGTAHICNSDLLGSSADHLIAAYYGIPDFNDTPAEYALSDSTQLMLSADQFRDAFRLGLRTIDEIAAFLQVHECMKINELLSWGEESL